MVFFVRIAATEVDCCIATRVFYAGLELMNRNTVYNHETRHFL